MKKEVDKARRQEEEAWECRLAAEARGRTANEASLRKDLAQARREEASLRKDLAQARREVAEVDEARRQGETWVSSASAREKTMLRCFKALVQVEGGDGVDEKGGTEGGGGDGDGAGSPVGNTEWKGTYERGILFWMIHHFLFHGAKEENQDGSQVVPKFQERVNAVANTRGKTSRSAAGGPSMDRMHVSILKLMEQL